MKKAALLAGRPTQTELLIVKQITKIIHVEKEDSYLLDSAPVHGPLPVVEDAEMENGRAPSRSAILRNYLAQ